jgi:hypothetical protein
MARRSRSIEAVDLRSAAILLAYVALAAGHTWPLLKLLDSHIAGNAGDDLLNASILWWNATTVPLTPAWWNQPHFYPAHGVTTFTENLLGLGPIATPLYWITRDAIATYNLTLFLTWPLSAFAAYLLVRHLSGRRDVAFIAGLAYGFSTYRVSSLGHIQTVSSFWLPTALLALHKYRSDRRPGWLALFAAAWVLQSLANGHFLLFSLVLIALWLLYFCTTKTHRRAGLVISAVWIAAGLTLLPVLLQYRSVHEHYGFWRDLRGIALSAPLTAWAEVASESVWSHVLPYGRHNLFPGITAPVLLALGALVLLVRRRPDLPALRRGRRGAMAALVVGLLAALIAIVVTLLRGPWQWTAGVTVRVTDLNRPIALALVCGLGFVWLSARARQAVQRRSVLVFYASAAVVMGLFAMGPAFYTGDHVLFEYAPYRWLLYLPGFTSLRAPARFWMLGVLCLSVAAALAYGRLTASRGVTNRVFLAAAIAGLLLDGWTTQMPMAAAPDRAWPIVEPPGAAQPPILELPFRERSVAATFRSMGHRRRVVNGASGHDPPHYELVADALERRDPEILFALATLGPIDIVVERSARPDSWEMFVAGVPGATLIANDPLRAAYRLVAMPYHEPRLGPPLAIRGVDVHPGTATAAIDGRLDTAWTDGPQNPDQWLRVELDGEWEVAGVTLVQPAYAQDYPRRLAIDLSPDGRSWTTAWEGSTMVPAFRGVLANPREVPVSVAFPPAAARHVRLRQLARHPYRWFVAEVRVHAPVNRPQGQ